MRVYLPGGSAVDLTQSDFVASGGEGSVYAKGSTAFKVFADPKKVTPKGKVAELAEIKAPEVIRPLEVVSDKSSTPVGLTYAFVPDSVALCQTFTRAFRERVGLDRDRAVALAHGMRGTVSAVHAAKILIVDLNEMNFLVSKGLDRVFFIDVDSYQTRSFPATALMESVRDRHAPKNRFNEGTDWFAFAVVSFQMMVGIHPYKGRHPTLKTLDDRMKANVSVLHKDVSVPKVCYPLSDVPKPYLDWYERVLERGEREPPPASLTAAAVPAATQPQRMVHSTDALLFEEVREYDDVVLGVWDDVTVTASSVYVGRRRVCASGSGPHALGLSPRSKTPVLASAGGQYLTDLGNVSPVRANIIPNAVACSGGRIYEKIGDKVIEDVLIETPNGITVGQQVVANILPRASSLWEGCVVQDLLGSCFVSVFPKSGIAHQVRVKEMDRRRVVSAKYDGGVFMAVVSADGGRYRRLVLRFSDDCTHYDARFVDDVPPHSVNFVTLDSGVCVCLNEDEEAEAFRARMGSQGSKVVADGVLGGDMRLWKSGGKVVVSRGNKTYRMSLK